MVLELVDRNPGVGHREVAHAMSSAPSVMTSVMRPLVDGGLVRREAASGDGRKVSYRLSEAGRRRFSALRPRIADAEARLLAGLDAAAADRFRQALRHIAGRPRLRENEK
jgi:DNA-binding MarR family transcriptional regulator